MIASVIKPFLAPKSFMFTYLLQLGPEKNNADISHRRLEKGAKRVPEEKKKLVTLTL
jgi:hypothetical protein